MKRLWKKLISLLLLATTPFSLLASPQEFPQVFSIQQSEKDHFGFSFDKVIELLEEIESGEIEDKYTLQDLEKINHLIVFLARQGVHPDSDKMFFLEQDIATLLGSNSYESAFSLWYPDSTFVGYNGDWQTILCKNWFVKKYKEAKKFCKEHKKEIIIGALVFVGGTLVVGGVIAICSASAAASAAGVAVSSSSDKEESTKDISPISPTPETPILKSTLDAHASSLKEHMAHTTTADRSFIEEAREVGAHFAHKAYDELATLTNTIPQLCTEIKDLSSHILPENISPPGHPQKNYENLVAKGHQAIDNAFSTDQAQHYNPEAKIFDRPQFSVALLPLPGMINNHGIINIEGFSKLGRVIDRAEYTKAGRHLMKHGYREGSIFPKPIGNPAKINAHGQEVLEKILNHPDKIVIQYAHTRYGSVIEVEAPGLGGARFNGEATEMMGFLEPKRFK